MAALSPDLNPIENLWSTMKLELDNYVISNRAELFDRAIAIWNNFHHDTLINLIESMPHRIDECIRNKGGNTHY